jgi:predicted small secreted protein
MAWTIPVSLPMLGLMSALTSFNTFEGLGKDVERGAEHVQDAAKDITEKM